MEKVFMKNNVEEVDEIEELIKQLKEGNKEVKEQIKKMPDVTDENMNEYICQKITHLVENGVDTVDAIKGSLLASALDSKEIESFSILFKSVIDAVDVLNKINLQNKKAKTQKEIKEMEVTQRQIEGPKTNQTNILIATREEIIKNFLEEAKKPIAINEDEVIDV
jgi:hypothetical protein